MKSEKDLFIVNCGTVNNIPFYQKVYRKFSIKCHVICDTDEQEISTIDSFTNPNFKAGIQRTISEEHSLNCRNIPRIGGLLRVHNSTFEPAHKNSLVSEELQYPEDFNSSDGKPFNANRYWIEILEPKFNHPEIDSVPIISHLKEIIEFSW